MGRTRLRRASGEREAADHTQALDLRYWSNAHGEGREVDILDGKQRRDVPFGTPQPNVPPSANKPPDLREFPTEPAAVAARMRELARDFRNVEPTTRDYVIAAMQMITDERGTPPDVLRAIFRFLSERPGMRLIGAVRDPLGRPGQAVAADGDPDIHEGIGAELIVNPDTGRPLAMVHYRDGDVNRPWLETIRQEGVVRGTEALPG